MNIQFVPQRQRRLAVTNIGEFKPGEVKLVALEHEKYAKDLIARGGDFIETGRAPGVYPLESAGRRRRK